MKILWDDQERRFAFFKNFSCGQVNFFCTLFTWIGSQPTFPLFDLMVTTKYSYLVFDIVESDYKTY